MVKKKPTFLQAVGREMARNLGAAELAGSKRLWERIVSRKSAEQVSLFKSGGPDRKEEHGHYVMARVAGREFQLQYRAARQTPPAEVEFVLFMLSRERREDVLADLDDWYASWCVKFGTPRAKFLCWWRVTCCVGGAVLEALGRVGEFISKVAPK